MAGHFQLKLLVGSFFREALLIPIFLFANSQPGLALDFWFQKPASDWEREGLPIGNGAMGAVITGGVSREVVQFNEKTLWEGGPGAQGGYTFGLPSSDFFARLQAVQKDITTTGSLAPQNVADRLGEPVIGYGNYQNFGRIILEYEGIDNYNDYKRSLDLDRAVAQLSFVSKGVRYQREYLASYPDRLIAVRLTASTTQALNLRIGLETDNNRTAHFEYTVDGIAMRGSLHDNGLEYGARLAVLVQGGEARLENHQIRVKKASSVVLLLSAATNYAPTYPHYRSSSDWQEKLDMVINQGRGRGFSEIRRRHLRDYRHLFQRQQLYIGGQDPQLSIDQILSRYTKSTESLDRHLETLIYQYGRYLLIASSRPGSLPANLQGVWNHSNTPPWNSDYHVNINLQMNYWPALPGNLAETAIPLYDFIDALIPAGQESAKVIAGARGWTMFLNTNIFGYTGLISWPTAFWQPEAAAWLARLYYEGYLFSQDKSFLEARAYPAMKGATQFWIDYLEASGTSPEGTYLVNPSYSPEHGDFSAGAAMSQQIVKELFRNTLEAAILVDDKNFASLLSRFLNRVEPGLRVGAWGQLQEWREDLDQPGNQHRHISHLYALHPGKVISPLDAGPYATAARVSLHDRGDSGTGWSKAWKINMWARLLDGDRAHKLLTEQILHSTLPNLWDNHPPFQIDGNFGATSGVLEMLLQSHRNELHLLPALPTAWDVGYVRGLVSRGNVYVDLQWYGGKLQRAVLHPQKDGPLSLRLPGCHRFEVLLQSNQKKLGASCINGLKVLNVNKGSVYEVRLKD